MSEPQRPHPSEPADDATGPDLTRRSFVQTSAAASLAVPLSGDLVAGAPLRRGGDPIRVGVVGVRGRGRGHVGAYKKSKNAIVTAICDADESVIGGAMKASPGAKYFKDLRKMLESDTIDAVSIAMPNHWHSLATIWALEAGKHVYVEKPISHNLYEGRRVVETAKKTGLVVQHGTQARSMKATRDAIAFLHSGALGKVLIARGLCYKRRKSIGKVDGPQSPPESLDFDLWSGPAEKTPLMRKQLHYDWHWDFNTGNGDLGNQGVHQMDIARWGLGKPGFPSRVVSIGGRLGYEDDGNTPNTMVSSMDYGDGQQLIFEVRGLPTKAYQGAKIGVIFHCEGGYVVIGSYGNTKAFDYKGKMIKNWRGGGNHFQNFLDAVQAGAPDQVNADALEGHLSSGLCHLGNISYQVGQQQKSSMKLSGSDLPFGADIAGNDGYARFRAHLVENDLKAKDTAYVMGPDLAFDGSKERFVGAGVEHANKLLSRKYREGFGV